MHADYGAYGQPDDFFLRQSLMQQPRERIGVRGRFGMHYGDGIARSAV